MGLFMRDDIINPRKRGGVVYEIVTEVRLQADYPLIKTF